MTEPAVAGRKRQNASAMTDYTGFIRDNTAVGTAPLVPEIQLHLASAVTPLWQATETALAREGLPPPFWAFAWPGGQALARYILDHADIAAGRHVTDFGSGGGLAGLAAKLAGADAVTLVDIDPFAATAQALNAGLNRLTVDCICADIIGTPVAPGSLLIAGDVCYEKPFSSRLVPWLSDLAQRGVTVLLADPDRAYRPRDGITPLADYAVPTSKDLEDREVRETTVWCLGPATDR